MAKGRVRKSCKAKNCNNTSAVKSYCHGHYKVFQKGGNPDFVEVKQKDKCSVASCEYTIVNESLGYCDLHYKRYQAKGVDGLDRILNRDLPCAIDDCENLRLNGELCNTHYLRVRKHGDPHIGAKIERPKVCIVDGCDGKHSALGYCALHYKRSKVHDPNSPEFLNPERNKRITKFCSVDDCSRKTYAGEYCSMHNRRYQKHGNPNIGAAVRNDPICEVEGCLKATKLNNMCPMHNARWKKYGDVNYVPTYPDYCTLHDCNNKHAGLGYCLKHYKKFKKYGNPYGFHVYESNIGTKPCSIDGCSNMNYIRGWCNTHYSRWLHHGDPLWKAFDTEEKETLLYKMFNSDGEIIYIGITCCYEVRMREHRNSKFWWDEVDSITTRKYSNRIKALEAEKRAIKKYNPVYNIIHNKKAA